jgi:hypothetical protein
MPTPRLDLGFKGASKFHDQLSFSVSSLILSKYHRFKAKKENQKQKIVRI